MTERTRDPHDAWIDEFTDELRRRHVEEAKINDAINSIREHLGDSGGNPTDAFGNPREYAASLDLPTRDAGYGHSGPYAAVVVAVLSFAVFGFAVTRRAGGDDSTPTTLWAIGAATLLLVASIWLTIGIARRVVDATVRESFTGEGAGVWSRWAPLAIAVPWVFPTFAAILVAGSTLQP